MPDPLTPEMATTIEALLPPGTPGREQLLAQVPHTTVGERCRCGCVTTDLIVDRSTVGPAPASTNPVGEASFVGGGVPLFTDAGYLSLLEVYSVHDDPIMTFPAPGLLELSSE
jgi:hypothetical protein